MNVTQKTITTVTLSAEQVDFIMRLDEISLSMDQFVEVLAIYFAIAGVDCAIEIAENLALNVPTKPFTPYSLDMQL